MQNKSVTEIEEGCKATPCNQSELIEPLGCERIKHEKSKENNATLVRDKGVQGCMGMPTL